MKERYKLYNGDCLEAMKDIPDNSVNLVLIDPPYNIGKADWDNWETVGEYVEFMGKVFLECQRVLKDNGSFYFFHNDFLQMAELQCWIRNNTKFKFKSLITLSKTNKSYIKLCYGSQNKFRNYLNTAEYCLFYTFQEDNGYDDLNMFKSIREYFKSERLKLSHMSYKEINSILGFKTSGGGFASDVLNPYKKNWKFPTEEVYVKFQTLGICQKDYMELKDIYESYKYTFNKKDGLDNVWHYDFRKRNNYDHPTVKPNSLLKDIILYSSNENDVVLDCFMGSGSTGVASLNTNRKFIGIELDKNYFEISKKRIEESLNKTVD